MNIFVNWVLPMINLYVRNSGMAIEAKTQWLAFLAAANKDPIKSKQYKDQYDEAGHRKEPE